MIDKMKQEKGEKELRSEMFDLDCTVARRTLFIDEELFEDVIIIGEKSSIGSENLEINLQHKFIKVTPGFPISPRMLNYVYKFTDNLGWYDDVEQDLYHL